MGHKSVVTSTLRPSTSNREPHPLSDEEAAAWQMTGEELLERLWQYLRTAPGA